MSEKKRQAGFIGVVLLLAVSAVSADQSAAMKGKINGIQILRFGYAKAMTVSEVKKMKGTATQNLVGYSNISYVQEGIDRIPGKYKAVICVTYKINGFPQGYPCDIQMRTIHPKMTNPGTMASSMTDTWVESRAVGEEYNRGYEFDNDWEIVPGEWVFEFWIGGRKLAEKRFAVLKPGEK